VTAHTVTRFVPLAPIETTANGTVARYIAERILRCKSVPGSLHRRSFVETEVRLALDAAVATVRRAP
jgi:hypothetical protein